MQRAEIRGDTGHPGLLRGLAQGAALGGVRLLPGRAGWAWLLLIPLLAVCHGVGAATPSRGEELVLETVRAVHDLPAALASRARVHLVATVTYYDAGEMSLFVQDATGGIYIETDHRYPIRAGDVVSIDGRATPSYFTDVALDPVIHVLAAAATPVPVVQASYRMLMADGLDSRLVRVQGTVRAVDVEQHENAAVLHMDVNMAGGSVEVYQPGAVLQDGKLPSYAGSNGQSLLDALVEVTGVAGGAFDTKTQLTGIILYAQQASSVRVVRPAPERVADLPLTDIDEVFPSRRVEGLSRRLRLRGVLTAYKKGGSAVLEEDGKSIFVQTRENKEIPLGAVVEALGFASNQQYAPTLEQAELFDTGRRGVILPRLTTYDEAISGLYSDNLISLEGTLVSEVHATGVETVTIETSRQLVRGELEGTERLPDLAAGTRIRLTGVCRIVAGGPWRAPTMFYLDMRKPQDVAVLSAPAWSTVRHLLELLGVVLVVALGAVGWAMLLRHRVHLQTHRMARTMLIAKRRSGLLERITSNQPLDAVLSEICACSEELLPGMCCRYELEEGGETLRLEQTTPAVPLSEQALGRYRSSRPVEHAVLFSMALTNEEGGVVGRLSLSTAAPQLPLVSRYEVFAIVSEVAHLAVRQALLHQGLLRHCTHDALTDLPNRRLCEQRLRKALVEAEANRTSVVVLYLDVDRFKYVNDRHGHRIGDLYLKAIGSRLARQMRPGDTLARIGGDEFLTVVPQGSASLGQELRERLRQCFSEPYFLEGVRVDGAASIGLAIYPEHGNSAEDLKRYADHAMYLAKRESALDEGSPGLPEINILTPDELQLALERHQFHVAYQPQFSADGTLRGIEALLRLEDSILGTLTPDAFLSVAERCDTIVALGQWVLECALRDAMRWKLAEGPPVLLVVNVALRQIARVDFAATVLQLLESSGFPSDRLELELTERTFLAGQVEIDRQMELLRAAGVRLSIDAFGTGQSSLSLLHRLPIDTIKVDRSFIAALATEPDVAPVVQAIVYMARCLHKRVVAEGVEVTTPLEVLLAMGEMDFQGFLLSRPISANQLAFLLPMWRLGLPMPAGFAGATAVTRRLVAESTSLPA